MNKCKDYDNSECVALLQQYENLPDAVESIGLWLDNIIVGAVNLSREKGSTRPHSVNTVFVLLSNLMIVNTPNIMESHMCEERQAQRLASCLRVASRCILAKLKLDDN